MRKLAFSLALLMWSTQPAPSADSSMKAPEASPAARLGATPQAALLYANRAALAAAHVPSGTMTVLTLSHSTAGDGGGATWKKLGAMPTPVYAYHLRSADGAWWQIADDPLAFASLGGVGDASTANDAAMAAAYAAIIHLGVQIHVRSGVYKVGCVSWDLTPRGPLGFSLYGAGRQNTIFDSSCTTGPLFKFYGSGGTVGPGVMSVYYWDIRDMGFRGSIAGTVFQLGNDDFSDAVNVPTLRNVEVQNLDATAAAEGCRWNYVVGALADSLQCNANWHGIGLRLRQVQFATFNAPSIGTADKCIQFDGGVNFGVVFNAPDIENCSQYGVWNTSSATGSIKFNAGQFNYIVGAYLAGSTKAHNATALQFDNVNFAPDNRGQTLYNGAIDPTNRAGLYFRGDYGDATPAIPSASGVPLTNSTGQTQSVVIWGGAVTSIRINGSTIDVPSGTFPLKPNDSIAWVGSAAPSWRWFPLN
jgi:hypothetical protein